jgi:hypothetical protein
VNLNREKFTINPTNCAGLSVDPQGIGDQGTVADFGKLPHVIFLLNGQVPLRPEVVSKSVRNGHLKAMVKTVPDAPIGNFTLKLFGGKVGYLVNTRNLCASPVTTKVEFVGQNGKTLTDQVPLKTNCG